MKDFTLKEQATIRDYFQEPSYPQPHAEIVAVQLLAAMILSGKYELPDYPRLAEAAIKLTKILAVRFNAETRGEEREEEAEPDPKLDIEGDPMNFNNESDYDPIPF